MTKTLPDFFRIAPVLFVSCLSLLCQVQAQAQAQVQEQTQALPAQAAVALTLPPAAKQYLPFYAGPQLDFAIDPDSISVVAGSDAEIRYALKATSKQGAVNISYEGIRCSNRQKIVYAVGAQDGSWSLSRDPEWNAIYVRGINVPHATLAHDYFCSVVSVAGSAADIRRRLISKTPME